MHEFGPLHTRKLVDFLLFRPTLELVSYTQIAKLIGEPYPSPTAIKSYYEARNILLEIHQKLFLTARGMGVFLADELTAQKYLHLLKTQVKKNRERQALVKLAA